MKRLFLIVSLLFLASIVFAQDGRQLLTLEEALNKTLNENPQIQAIEYEELAAMNERKAAFGLRLPQVGVNGIYAHLGKDIGVDINHYKEPIYNLLNQAGSAGIQLPGIITGPVNNLLARDWGVTIVDQDIAQVGGTITLPVYTGGKINAANAAAAINEKATRTRGDQSRNALVSELVERYYGLSLAHNVVRVREQVVDAMQLHLDDARALEENGMIARTELLLFEVTLAEAQKELVGARSQVRTITDALSNTLNDQQSYVPVSLMFILRTLEPVNYYKELALDNNPLLKEVTFTRELAEQDVRLKRSEYFPQVVVMGGASFCRYHGSSYIPKWAVGAGVSINIFDGLARENKLRASKNTVRRVESLEIKAGNDITTLVESIYNQLVTLEEKLPYLDRSLEFATEYLRSTELGFREGMKSATDVTDAELNLARTKIERMETAYTYDLMLAALLEAAGISEEFPIYAQRGDAMHVRFE